MAMRTPRATCFRDRCLWFSLGQLVVCQLGSQCKPQKDISNTLGSFNPCCNQSCNELCLIVHANSWKVRPNMSLPWKNCTQILYKSQKYVIEIGEIMYLLLHLFPDPGFWFSCFLIKFCCVYLTHSHLHYRAGDENTWQKTHGKIQMLKNSNKLT